MFYTQLEAAQKGFVTDAMKIVAEKERMDVEQLRALVALGQVVIPVIRIILVSIQRASVKHCARK